MNLFFDIEGIVRADVAKLANLGLQFGNGLLEVELVGGH
jgi:hypothetical protein